MKTIAETVEVIEFCRGSSEQRWEMAIETDDSNRGFEEMMTECLECYDAAIETLNEAYENYIGEARGHLENASQIERDAGDNQDAQRALAALDELDPEADR